MKLSEARFLFSYYISSLVLHIDATPGYRVAYGEGMDRRTGKDPTSDHLEGGTHDVGLGQDLDLYRLNVTTQEWEYCQATEDHQQFGELWESWGEESGYPLRWGGRFGDGNHYSWEWEGRR